MTEHSLIVIIPGHLPVFAATRLTTG